MTGFSFDAKAALQRAYATREHPNPPNLPNWSLPAPQDSEDSEGSKAFEETSLTGNPDELANIILGDVRGCKDEGALQSVLARYREEIDRLKAEAPVRAIHVTNLIDYKRADPAWPRNVWG